ncbi:MAG TPA: nucleotide disphospho-sugar-binding domain-containing protein [Chloroflexia bacterium]|nr:nucleotide disphospho-sugar-binding domain-containing protein [Chloroflexia bacterium]
MARFLIGTIPQTGHVGPALPIARELVGRGNEVWWYTGKRFQSRIEATGARYIPSTLDYDERNIDEVFPGRVRLNGLAKLKYDIKHGFIDPMVGQVQDYTEILREFPADVLLCDTAFLGAACVHEKGGPPWATYGMTALTINSRDTAPFGLGLLPDASASGRLRNRLLNWLLDNVLFRDVVSRTDRARVRMGLPPTGKGIFDVPLSPYLYLQGTTQSFEYPISDLPPQVHFIGPFLPEPPRDFTPPRWWDELKSGRTVVHVTQGTIATVSDELLVPALQALAGEDMLVIAATGNQPLESVKIDPLPANARLEQFIPYYHLMPHVDVMVTNGGYGGVQSALAHGIPIVAAGKSEDKIEISARVAWSGVGINLRTQRPTPERIRQAVKEVLADPKYRRKAEQIKADFAGRSAPHEAADLLERLAETKQPVYRADRRAAEHRTYGLDRHRATAAQ